MAWSKATRISIMLAIDVAFFVLELGSGIVVGSLALMADAFHMLNDIISLCVGLWAVKLATESSKISDKYSFGYLRAEVLGAFFNAVFLIALCFSIIMEALQRLFDPPQISNPILILTVGCLGLLSNIVGFFVLGGHGHSHGPGEEHDHDHDHDDGHTHSHDPVKNAEEGRAHSHDAENSGRAADVFPEAVVAKANGQHKRRRSSVIRRNRLSGIDDLSIHPASFRQDIIKASRLDGAHEEAGSSFDDPADGGEHASASENTPLLSKSKHAHAHNHDHGHEHNHDHPHSHDHDDGGDEHLHHHGQNGDVSHSRQDSWHQNHNHKKPKKASKGMGGHNHDDMGMRAMILHVIGDMLGNVGVIVAALVIWFFESPLRFYADPAVSFLITIIILWTAIPLTMGAAKILLQATPDALDVSDIKQDIQSIPGVVSCHHVHIWELSQGRFIASMHIQVAFPIQNETERYMELAKRARECLHAYNIHSATIQPEFCLDKNHNHVEGSMSSVDGEGLPIESEDSCLLECVDDCASGLPK